MGIPSHVCTPEALLRQGSRGIPMYNVIKQEAPDRWVKELYFQTEFRAYLCALTKSKALMTTYMVVDTDTNEAVSYTHLTLPTICSV